MSQDDHQNLDSYRPLLYIGGNQRRYAPIDGRFIPESVADSTGMRNRWGNLCRDLNKRDNDPPYRDEQRAWYDTLRDFAPELWETGKTIRLYSRDLLWCTLNVEKESDLEAFKNIILSSAEEIRL